MTLDQILDGLDDAIRSEVEKSIKDMVKDTVAWISLRKNDPVVTITFGKDAKGDCYVVSARLRTLVTEYATEYDSVPLGPSREQAADLRNLVVQLERVAQLAKKKAAPAIKRARGI